MNNQFKDPFFMRLETPFFVRCIKANGRKSDHREIVLNQIYTVTQEKIAPDGSSRFVLDGCCSRPNCYGWMVNRFEVRP